MTTNVAPTEIRPLTAEQRRIVEWGDGPVVVIAGAGTGKTRVIVERVRWLLENREGLLPEQILVLTYNVKAARELQERLDADGRHGDPRADRPSRNFHSFCHRILTENAADAGLPARPDVLDGVGQVLLLRDILRRPAARSTTRGRTGRSASFVGFINRAKDELVDARRVRCLRRRGAARVRGAHTAASTPPSAGSPTQGNLGPLREIRGAYAWVRAERARRGRAARRPRTTRPRSRRPPTARPAADRRDRRAPMAQLVRRRRPPADRRPEGDLRRRRRRARGPAPDRDRRRLPRLRGRARAARRARLRRADRRRHDTLQDPPEHPAPLAAPVPLHPGRRVPGREHRPDRADRDARPNARPARQRHGRRRRRPVDLPVPGRQLRGLRRVRRAVLAAARARPDATPPGPPPRLRIEQNFRSVRNVLTAANRLIGNNGTRFEPDKRLTTDRPDGDPVELVVCAGAEDEAVAIVDAIKSMVGEGTGRHGPTSPSCTASTSTARRSSRGCATRTSRTPSSAG